MTKIFQRVHTILIRDRINSTCIIKIKCIVSPKYKRPPCQRLCWWSSSLIDQAWRERSLSYSIVTFCFKSKVCLVNFYKFCQCFFFNLKSIAYVRDVRFITGPVTYITAWVNTEIFVQWERVFFYPVGSQFMRIILILDLVLEYHYKCSKTIFLKDLWTLWQLKFIPNKSKFSYLTVFIL